MIKNTLIMIVLAVILIACGDSNDSKMSSDSKESIVNSKQVAQDSNATKVDSADSKDSKDLSANIANSADFAKKPQDLYKKCIACHGTRGEKVAPGSAGNVVIADLNKQMLVESMKGYRAKTLSRGGTAAIMYLQANNLSDEDIEILGEYIASFKK